MNRKLRFILFSGIGCTALILAVVVHNPDLVNVLIAIGATILAWDAVFIIGDGIRDE